MADKKCHLKRELFRVIKLSNHQSGPKKCLVKKEVEKKEVGKTRCRANTKAYFQSTLQDMLKRGWITQQGLDEWDFNNILDLTGNNWCPVSEGTKY